MGALLLSFSWLVKYVKRGRVRQAIASIEAALAGGYRAVEVHESSQPT
jgi:hypothetical protein